MATEAGEKMAAMSIEGPSKATEAESEAAAIYTSELRGSDDSGEGTYKVPYKTILQVDITVNSWFKHLKFEAQPLYIDLVLDLFIYLTSGSNAFI